MAPNPTQASRLLGGAAMQIEVHSQCSCPGRGGPRGGWSAEVPGRGGDPKTVPLINNYLYVYVCIYIYAQVTLYDTLLLKLYMFV